MSDPVIITTAITGSQPRKKNNPALIGEAGVPARHIAAVTFTNKAAREMKARVGELLTGKDGRGLMVSTFHTLGLNILQQEYSLLGYRKGFSILDARDAGTRRGSRGGHPAAAGARVAERVPGRIGDAREPACGLRAHARVIMWRRIRDGDIR